MRIENNNKEVIKRITNRSLKSNKVRNIFVILAIVLTTFMISSIFSIGISFIKNYQIMNTRISGTTANVSLPNPTKEQINKLETLDMFKSMGTEINVGKISLDSLEENRTKILLKYSDKENFQKQITPAISDIEGSYPTKSNGIMISRLALDFLDKDNVKVGDRITIPCKINGVISDKVFTIDGIFTSYALAADTGYIYLSKSFCDKQNLNVKDNGSLSMTLKKNSSINASEILEKEIKLNDNQEFKYSYVVDDISSTAISTAILVLVIVFFFILSGYLLIYNVLYIAVTKDINFYGMLKTIGASPRQIKAIVKRQGLKLSIIGIPIGLILGAVVSFAVVPAVMGTFFNGTNSIAMPSDVSFNPLIFILATFFSFITVFLSCRKPAKIAGNISPIEALRYVGSKSKKQKKNRNTTNGGKLYKMAWYNVFNDKKKAILVFLSLFMGIITFLSVNTFVDSMKVENYINRYVKNDFELQNLEGNEGKIDDTLLDDIKNMTGIEEINTFKLSKLRLTMSDEVILPALKSCYPRFGLNEDDVESFIENAKDNPEFLDTSIIGVDDSLTYKVNKESDEKFDIEAFKEGKLILIDSWYYGENYKDIEGSLTITNIKSNVSETFNTDVINLSNYFPDGNGDALGIPTIYMSQSALEKLDSNPINYLSYINVEKKYEPQIKANLENIAKNKGLILESKTSITEEFNKTAMVEKVLGGGISFILILIGVLNFVNVMITGVNIRLKELAVMESIGMTKKQIKKMLTFEGLYYACITTGLICTIGIGIIFGISILAHNVADYAVFSFPTIPLIVLIILIFIICLITPSTVFKASSKKSVTERIREIEQ